MHTQDQDKSKAQLIQELQDLRRQVAEFEASGRVRQHVEHSQARLLAILDATTDFVGIADIHGRSLYVNQAGRRMVGMGQDEPETNMLVFDHHPEWVRIQFSEILPIAAQHGVWSGETALLHRDGHEIPVSQVILAHKGPEGNVEYFSTIARDISLNKALEEQRADFLAMLAHDIKNPLSAILGYIDLLLEEFPADSQKPELGFIQRLKSNALTITSLIANYLDLAKVEAGRLVLHKTPQDLGQILQNICDQYEAVAQRNGQVIHLERPDNIPRLLSDPVALERVFANLIQNALKFTPTDGHIFISMRPDAQQLIVEVKDTGDGIPLEDLQRLFEKFRRADTPHRYDGLGLGLFIVKTIVEAHGGRVEAENSPTGGACFRVILSAGAAEDKAEARPPTIPPEAPPRASAA